MADNPHRPNDSSGLLEKASQALSGGSDRTVVDGYGRMFVGCLPSVFLADSKVYVYIPPFVHVPIDGTELRIRPQAGRDSHAGGISLSDDGTTLPALIPLDDLGISPLGGYRVMLGGSVLFKTAPLRFIFFDASGCRVMGPTECVSILMGPDSMLDGRGFGYTESYRPDGSCLVGITSDDGRRFLRVRPLEDGESRRFRVLCRPDRVVMEQIARVTEAHPAEDFEPEAVRGPDGGFLGQPPRVLVLNGRPVLSIPPYSGCPEDPFGAVLEWPDGSAELGRLPRISDRESLPTFVDLERIGAGLSGGLLLRVDGCIAYVYPPSELSLFSQDGVLSDMPEGRVTAVSAEGTVLCGDGFEVLEERSYGGTAISILLVDPDGIVLADDVDWDDEDTEEEWSEDASGEASSEEPQASEEDAAEEEPAPGPVSKAMVFPNGLPALVFDGQGFVIRIPSFTAPASAMSDLELSVGGREQAAVHLSGSVRGGMIETYPEEIPMKRLLRASPFDEIDLRMGDAVLFHKDAGDQIVMDRRYVYTGVLDGPVIVALRKRVRFDCPYAVETSRRAVAGVVLVTCVAERPPEAAPVAPMGHGGPRHVEGQDVSASFVDEPLELCVKPLPYVGAQTVLEEGSMPAVPFFSHSPRLAVSASAEGCSVTVSGPDGRTLFGPVDASGIVFLDTGGYSGFARASVSVPGEDPMVLDYIVDPGFWFELPDEGFIHAGGSMARIGWNRRRYSFAVRDGIPLSYESRPALMKFNVVLYYVSVTVGGMTTRSLLSHRIVGSTELGSRISVDAVISGDGTPVFMKRIAVSAGDGPVEPLTRTWTEGEIEADASGFLRDMAADHLDRHLFIEEEGRGSFEFLRVKWVPSEHPGEASSDQAARGQSRQ